MSNVLIGIIGVILFIGLALAGGVIYGTDFTTATAEGKAAQYANAMSQTAHATNLMQMKTGATPIAGQLDAQIVPRFVKTRPNVDGNTVNWRDSNNAAPGGTQATLVTIPIPAASVTPFLNNVCAQLETDNGNATSTPPSSNTLPSKPTGCVVLSSAYGLDPSGTMIFYYHI